MALNVTPSVCSTLKNAVKLTVCGTVITSLSVAAFSEITASKNQTITKDDRSAPSGCHQKTSRLSDRDATKE